MKRIKILIYLLFSVYTVNAQQIYKNSKMPIEDRVDDLLGKMTLEEKIMQLTQYVMGRDTNPNNVAKKVLELSPNIGSFIFQLSTPELSNKIQKKAVEESRLGIPVLFGADVIHGLKTLYPIPIAQACSWNTDLAKKASEIAARETRMAGIAWTFSPMIDVAYDPRWGRVSEGYGEDPYVNAQFAIAAVKGYQGKSLNSSSSVAACLKHFVGYSRSEGGRDYNYTDISRQSLWETYFPPYIAGINSGAATVMSAFNDISGVPATANHYTLTEVLKETWGYDGFVVSDWNGVVQLVAQGFAKDEKEAAEKAILSGVDMNMLDGVYKEHLATLVQENKVPISRIDDAVKRVLRLKFKLGLFENPYTKIVPEKQRTLLQKDKDLIEKLTEESMVLLKNRNNILPLKSSIKKILLTGPMTKDTDNVMGTWTSQANKKDVINFYDGINSEYKNNIQIDFAHGCNFDGEDESGFAEAFQKAQSADVIMIFAGEIKKWSGENGNKSSIELPAIQEKLIYKLHETGKPIILILSSGRPIGLKNIEPLSEAIIQTWQPGLMGGKALARIISGRINPSGKLAITFPLSTGQIPIHYNRRPSARPEQGKYVDISTSPMYEFGHGLSYSNFEYKQLTLSKNSIKKEEKITAKLTVRNNSNTDGLETVLWYITDPVASITRPIKELKHFEKKKIKSGETVEFIFEIDSFKDLSFYNQKGETIVEEGDFYLHAGDIITKFSLTN